MAAAVYAADPPAARRTIALDGLTLVYHRPSRATHLLASPAPELLDALEAGPADAATLARRLLGADADAAAEQAVAARLAELEAAGLVARA